MAVFFLQYLDTGGVAVSHPHQICGLSIGLNRSIARTLLSLSVSLSLSLSRPLSLLWFLQRFLSLTRRCKCRCRCGCSNVVAEHCFHICFPPPNTLPPHVVLYLSVSLLCCDRSRCRSSFSFFSLAIRSRFAVAPLRGGDTCLPLSWAISFVRSSIDNGPVSPN